MFPLFGGFLFCLTYGELIIEGFIEVILGVF
jgi:hypothetical protein